MASMDLMTEEPLDFKKEKQKCQAHLASNSDSLHFKMELEQICHHPPVASYRVTGPSFILYTPNGFESVFKAALNHIDMSFPDGIVVMETVSQGTFKWIVPSFRLDPIFSSHRTAGIHGDFWIEDPSGIKAVFKVSKGLVFKGQLVNVDGSVMDELEGDMTQGIFYKSKKGDVDPLDSNSAGDKETEPKVNLI